MRPSCSAFYGTHKFRANCCTGNWFCPWRRPRSIAMAISILQDRQVLPFSPPNPPPPFSMLASSSSLLQFCLNYFACLFMVESLISALVSLATLTTLQRRLQLAGCLAAWLPQLLQLLPHAWPRSRQRARRRIEERALPPYIYDRRQARQLSRRVRLRPVRVGIELYKCFEKWIIHVCCPCRALMLSSCCCCWSWPHGWKYLRLAGGMLTKLSNCHIYG